MAGCDNPKSEPCCTAKLYLEMSDRTKQLKWELKCSVYHTPSCLPLNFEQVVVKLLVHGSPEVTNSGKGYLLDVHLWASARCKYEYTNMQKVPIDEPERLSNNS